MPPTLNSNQLSQDLEVIERNIRQLEAKYTDYLDGVTSIEPKELRTQTEALVNRWWGKPVVSTMLRFKLQNTVQKYKTYKEKWDRLLRIKKKNDLEDGF
jgi:predicted nucleotide-binding protein (sugar kinase/HSP70/actin superfamily)